MVWSYDAFQNPSIGPFTFLRLAYNSRDGSDRGAGYGMSVQPATLTRLGEGLSKPTGNINVMTLVDGDGTTQTYKVIDSSEPVVKYARPAGAGLELTWDTTVADVNRQWRSFRISKSDL